MAHCGQRGRKELHATTTAEGYDIQPSAGSLNGQKFKGPGGEIYFNRGEVKFPMVTETGKQAVGEFQVQRLASLAKRKISMHRRNGVYVMPVWVQEPGSTPSKAPFQRRGT